MDAECALLPAVCPMWSGVLMSPDELRAAAGGHMVTTGYAPILQKVGSVYTTNNVPIQECRVG